LGTRFTTEPADTTGIDLPMPVAAAHVTGISGPQDLLGRLVGGRRNRLVGREAEAARLQKLWERVSAGAGQVVLVSGEAGIGKSRLLGELAETLPVAGHERIAAFCTPQTTDSSLYPLIEPLRLSLGLPEQGLQSVIKKLLLGDLVGTSRALR
ncbi:MAG: AAA family ATPase, partial [Rhodospirillales bacterium]|nr:AAA family ATPase [Rhodospirillales bacterium]